MKRWSKILIAILMIPVIGFGAMALGFSYQPTDKEIGWQFMTANPVDLSQIAAFSQYRSCAGHDYRHPTVMTGEFEKTPRSMKHYVKVKPEYRGTTDQVPVFAPFYGKITTIDTDLGGPNDQQIWLTPTAANPISPRQWQFVFFHINLDPSLRKGSIVKAGQPIGTANLARGPNRATDNFDIAMKFTRPLHQPAVDEVFTHMTPAVLAEFEPYGITAKNVTLAEADRDAHDCPLLPLGQGGDNPETIYFPPEAGSNEYIFLQDLKTSTVSEQQPPTPLAVSTSPTVPEKQIPTPPPAPPPSTPQEPTPLPPSVPASRATPEFPSAVELAQIPECAGQQFVTTPVDIKKLTSISPLGNLGPPAHTLPTEHMFFHLTPGGATTETIPLSAPADISLTLVGFSRGATQDPIDYTLYFALCKDVVGYYNHVKEVSPELENLIAQSACMFPGESKETRCNIQTLHPIKNGANLGRVGRLQGNFDFGLIDFRKPLVFANPNRYGQRSLYIHCALDYYSSANRNTLYGLLERTDGACGQTAQDVPGTLKGNWFYGSARADMGGDWDKHLAFVDDNKNPLVSVISIGGVFSNAEKWEFTPETSGTTNRAFADVTPDGQIYCYEGKGKSGRILTQLTSATELKIEKQAQACAADRAFTNPTTYTR